jgi:hypothetical protein
MIITGQNSLKLTGESFYSYHRSFATFLPSAYSLSSPPLPPIILSHPALPASVNMLCVALKW